MIDTYISKGLLTVHREIGFDTRLTEVWVLRSHMWQDEPSEDPVLNVYICDINDIGNSGVPHSDHSVHDAVPFSEAPTEVQTTIIDAIEQLENQKQVLQDNPDSDESETKNEDKFIGTKLGFRREGKAEGNIYIFETKTGREIECTPNTTVSELQNRL